MVDGERALFGYVVLVRRVLFGSVVDEEPLSCGSVVEVKAEMGAVIKDL